MAAEFHIPHLTFAQPDSGKFFENSDFWLPFNLDFIDPNRAHFPPTEFIYPKDNTRPGYVSTAREKLRVLEKAMTFNVSKWPYLQLYEVHRQAVLDGLFTEHLSESISVQERKVFMEYLRNSQHDFTMLVTKLFLTFRKFESMKLFTVKKDCKNWRHLQVALMAICGKDDAYYHEKHPGITEEELMEKKKEDVERSTYRFVTDGVYPKKSANEKVTGRKKQGRVIDFMMSPRVRSLLKVIKRKYDFQACRDKKIQLINAVAELRAGVPHKALERHAVEVSRLRASLSGKAQGRLEKLKKSIVCNFTTVEKEVDGVALKGFVRDVDCYNRNFKVVYGNGETEWLPVQEIIPLKKEDHKYRPRRNPPLNTPCQQPGCLKKAIITLKMHCRSTVCLINSKVCKDPREK